MFTPRFVRSTVAACVTISFLATSCAVNPATGKRQLSLVVERDEVAMGRQYDQEVQREMSLYPSQELQSYVQQLGGKLAANSERADLPWSFRLVDDPTVNAFALPGGFIYVTRGLLAHMNSEAELAGVVGHEIGHVTARHSVSQMSRQQLFSLGLGLGSVLSDTVAGLGQTLAEGLGLLFLKFSRDDEREADALGLRYIDRARYDPRPMISVFETLGAVARLETNERLPDWLSTHPSPEDRRQRIAQAIAALGPDLSGRTVNREEYLRRLDGMTYGDNPREGYFEQDAFYHPDLEFRLDTPSGWKRANTKSAMILQSAEGDAAIQLTLTDKDTVDAAASAFFGIPGVRRGNVERTNVNGLPAVVGEFGVTEQQQSLAGEVVFVSHGGKVYRILGLAPSDAWNGRKDVVRRSLRSFRKLTDASALAVKPMRIELVRIDRPMTLAEFHKTHPSSVDLERVAVLNHLSAESRIEAGTTVKRVVGGRGPGG